MTSPPNSLTGQFFLTFDANGRLEFQGEIIGLMGSEYYQIQFFSAGMGEQTDCCIYHLSEMKDWKFYLSKDCWHEAYYKSAKIWK